VQSDKKIWADFKSGDKKATSNIYHENIQLLYRYGKKLTTDDDLIKDKIQELFYDLIRTRENLGSTDNIRFYLIKALRRRIFSELKKKSLFVEPADNENDCFMASCEEELIEMENDRYRDEMVKKAVKMLSPRKREILFYRYSCNFEYNQICEIMNIEYDTARKLVFRGLSSLKEYLVKMDFILY
jgi:RNA polymerase sigma factor (sigma-70 family)